MKQFKTKEDGFKEIRTQLLKVLIPLLFVPFIGVIVIFEFTSITKANETNILPIMIPILLGTFAFGIYRGIKRQKAIYESFSLTIDDNCIIRDQHNTPTIRILFTDIKKITKTYQGGFVISGESSSSLIIIPTQIENKPELEKLLSEISEISQNTSKPLLQRLLLPVASIATIGLMVILYVSYNKILITISGTLLSILVVWAFIVTQQNKNFDKKTKRASYWFIILFIVILGISIYKIMLP
jgi:hypothetical protein